MLLISFWFFVICVVLLIVGLTIFNNNWEYESWGALLALIAVVLLLAGIFYRPGFVQRTVIREENVFAKSHAIVSANLDDAQFIIGDDQNWYGDFYVVYIRSDDGSLTVQSYPQSEVTIQKDGNGNSRVDIYTDRATCLPQPALMDFILSCKEYDDTVGYILHVPEDALVKQEY